MGPKCSYVLCGAAACLATLFPVVMAEWKHLLSPAFITPLSSSSLATHRSADISIQSFRHPSNYHKLVSLFSSVGEEEQKELWKVKGESLIRDAAIEAGADPTNLQMSWKPGKLIVTVSGNTVMGKGKLNEDDDDEEGEEDDNDYIPEEEEDDGYIPEEEDDTMIEEGKIDIVGVTRAINAALMNDEPVGLNIAETHEIEVTTPGASDILEGSVMFEAYKGFPVIVETTQLKKNGKPKILEGNLIEKNENEVRINVKGRISKVKNEFLVCVRLPKAKKEKGKRK